METHNYLTTALKIFYLQDFEKVLQVKDSFWGIPQPFLRDVLTSINTSNTIQTLYSKIKDAEDHEDEESYLVIGFKQNKEAELQSKLTNFAKSYSIQTASIDLMPPSENLNVGPTDFQIGAIHNPDYFNIYHFRITFISSENKDHEQFWIGLKELLVNF